MQPNSKKRIAGKESQHSIRRVRLRFTSQSERGFALPIVLIVGLFMLISGFTLSMQTFRSLSTARKGTHQQQAQYIAETGIAKIIEQLNSDYRYLMVNCYKRNQDAIFDPLSICGSREIGGWGQNESPLPRTPMAACLGNNNGNERNFSNYSENIILEQELGQADGGVDNKSIKGKWQLETYSFYGNHANGGKGIIQVRGTRTNRDNQVLATSVINKTILIKSKPCSRRLLDEFDPNHFPSLLARTIDIGSDDVVGKNTANVYCTSCASNEDINRARDSVIQGEINLGMVKLPDVPQFPAELREFVSLGNIETEGEESVEIKSPNAALTAFDPICDGCEGTTHIRPAAGKPMCITDKQKQVHCLINNINLQGSENLSIQTDQGGRPVFIYLKGNLTTNSNSHMINQDGNANDLIISGTSTGCIANTTQTIQLTGSNTLKAFIFAPCASLKINAAPNLENTAECSTREDQFVVFDNQSDRDHDGECKSGDLDGAAWIGEWVSDPLNSSGELTVPSNLSEQLVERLGPSFSVGPSDYVAVGTIDWTTSR